MATVKNDIKTQSKTTTCQPGSLPWFLPPLKTLSNAFNHNRLAHGLMIAAPSGSGKLSFANGFIKSVFCHQTEQSFTYYCGNCKACHLFEARSHPDFHLLERLTDNKGKQKQSIGIDQIRLLTQKLADKPQLGDWRIALITAVSDLTTASFNALLKTLEEPGEKTLIVLLCDNLQTVPATIRSRCQIIQPEFKKADVLQWLQLQADTTNEQEINSALENYSQAPLKAKDYLLNNGFNLRQQLDDLGDYLLLNKINPQEFMAKALEINSIEDLFVWAMDYMVNAEKAILLELTVQGNKQDQNEQNLKRVNQLKEVNQLKVVNQLKEVNNYRQVPKKLPLQLYAKLLDYQRAQISGSNLQAKTQLQAILIQWYEAGRKINYLSNR